ncbi:MarR family winged helix-turn-helix transcriptional regulator [Achromobacter sp. NPDC058515]|uniref:MarR family winged helix-turn-helix transcriptional regulator n=1 Tax=Achromobacter sp. NPDC058515 TaxID=3346533 RepID=UPI003650529F
MSVAEWVALNQIRSGAALTPAGIAGATGMTRGGISKVLEKLQSKGWISRETSPEDNRVQLLALTRQGEHVLPELTVISDDNDEHFFGALSTAEQDMLRQLLKKLADIHQLSNIPVD